MKTKKSDVLLCVLFCGFLSVMLVLFLLLPRQSYSEKEKRYLTEAPKLTWETLLSGEFGESAEKYLADHIPGRDFFVCLASYYDLLSGRQGIKDVHLAEGDRLVEAPVQWNQAAVEKNMTAINAFAEKVDCKVDLMIVPSAGFVLEDSILGMHSDYTDDEIISRIYTMAGDDLVCRDLVSVYNGVEDKQALYYRTDHHWTSRGAYTAYAAYMQMLGKDYTPADHYAVEQHGGFYGSNYSRSGLWMLPGENVELWKTEGDYTVTNGDSEGSSDSLFYTDRLEELDKYTVYLDGNHSTVHIVNEAAKGKGKLLVVRDSYANCLGTFLADSYEEIVLIDLRYYKKPVSELVASDGFSDVLICYSIGNFLTDANVIWLR